MNALIRRLREPRALGPHLLRLLITRSLAFVTVVGVLLLGQMIAVNPTSAPLDPLPSTFPSWTATDQSTYPYCMAEADWPQGKFAPEVIVYQFSDSSTYRIAFAQAWKVNHDQTDVNDLWVIGICPSR
jgi:hypothetical protein